MDRVRYAMALLAWVTLPPAILYWFAVHPFVHVWRRLGKAVTFTALTLLFVGCGFLLWLVREPVLAVEFGTDPVLWGPAALLYGFATWMQIRIRRHLPFTVMAGAPELEADGKGGKLLDEGLYARLRHPRYVAVLLATIAWALVANYLAVYLMVPVLAVGLAAVARLEERELVDRFGAAYERYRATTPMFIPRLRSR